MHTYTQTHAYTHVCTHTHRPMHAYTHRHMHVHRHMNVHIHTGTCMHTHTDICMHIHTHVHAHRHMHTHIHRHTCTHTRTHLFFSGSITLLLVPGIVNVLIHTPQTSAFQATLKVHVTILPFFPSFNLSGRGFQDSLRSLLPGLCSVQWPQGSCPGSGCSSCPPSVVRVQGSLPGGPKAHPDPKGISPRKSGVLLTVLLQTSSKRTQKSFRHHFPYCVLVFFTPPSLPFTILLVI